MASSSSTAAAASVSLCCYSKHGTSFIGFENRKRLTSCDNGAKPRNSWLSSRRVLRVVCATEGSAKSKKADETLPSWAKPDADEPPPWARNEGGQDSSSFEIPYYVYLLSSVITAIAAIGSAFEYVNEKPVFGVLSSDSIFYAPLLGFFVFTGIPTSGFLWYKSVQTANKEAEEQDKRDGYM